MDKRYFITEVYIPSGSRTIEHQLAAVARKYVDHVLSYDAMLRLADEVVREQERLCAANKRIRPVDVSINLDGDSYGFRRFHIGQVYVGFRYILGEII